MACTPAYATIEDVAAGFRPLTADELAKCQALIIEAGVLVDSVAQKAPAEKKCVVVCRMIRRVLGSAEESAPLGTNQNTVSALGYSQTWSLGTGGTIGELYLSKAEKTILGVANRIGASNPLMEACCHD